MVTRSMEITGIFHRGWALVMFCVSMKGSWSEGVSPEPMRLWE